MFFQSHRALPCEIACYSGPQSIFCNICIRMAFKSLKLFFNFNEKETSKDQFQFRYKIDTRGQTITRGAKSQLLQVQLSKICKKYVREKTRRKFILPILFPFPNLKLFLSFMQTRIYVCETFWLIPFHRYVFLYVLPVARLSKKLFHSIGIHKVGRAVWCGFSDLWARWCDKNTFYTKTLYRFLAKSLMR